MDSSAAFKNYLDLVLLIPTHPAGSEHSAIHCVQQVR